MLLDSSSPTARIAETLKELRAGILLSDGQNIELARRIAGNHCQVISSKSINFRTLNEDRGCESSPEP